MCRRTRDIILYARAVADRARSEPANLNDDIADAGDTDADLLRVIRDGARTGMRGFFRTLSAGER